MLVADIISNYISSLSLAQKIASSAIVLWLIQGGFVWILRWFSFIIDGMLIGIMSSIYSVFDKLLGGTMFPEKTVEMMTNRIYLFIGVIILFRLMLLLMKYLTNPDLTRDDKAGVNSLIKRVIIGIMGILFIPQLFLVMNNFQKAFLEDQVIQQLFIPKDVLVDARRLHANGGRYLGSFVLSGFLNPSKTAPEDSIEQYDRALREGDLNRINLNKGRGVGVTVASYHYDYMFFVSSIVLGYTLFILLQYALDLIVRFFKLFIYQLIAPIAMIEYMVNGSDAGMFASWKKAVLSTYFMVFTRVVSLWFVVLIMALMSNGSLGDDTLLAANSGKTDNLLRALIIIAALGFMKDLPKIIGELFGLDFEQASSATGILDKVKGGIKSVATVGAGLAGAAAGAAWGTGKAIGATGKALDKAGITDQAERRKKFAEARKISQGAALGAIGSQLMGSTGVTKALTGGFAGSSKEQEEAQQKAQQKEAIAEKRKHLNQGVTPEDKLIRAIQEVELRVAGEKLSDANIANKGYITQTTTSKSANDQNRQELAKAAVSNFSTGFQARIEAANDIIQVKGLIDNSQELNEAMTRFVGNRTKNEVIEEAKTLNTTGINFSTQDGQLDLMARYNVSGMGHEVLQSDVSAVVSAVSTVHQTQAENFTPAQKEEVMARISEINYTRQREKLADAIAKESMKITSSVSVTSDISEQTNYTQSVAATSEKILEQVQVQQETVQEEIKPKSKVILPGEENINPNAKIITPEEFRKNPDAKIITPGQENINPNAKIITPEEFRKNPDAKIITPGQDTIDKN